MFRHANNLNAFWAEVWDFADILVRALDSTIQTDFTVRWQIFSGQKHFASIEIALGRNFADYCFSEKGTKSRQGFTAAGAAFQLWMTGLAKKVPVSALVDRCVGWDVKADDTLQIRTLELKLNFPVS